MKLKYENGILFYQLALNGEKSYYDKITNFAIELEDKDGFKMSEIDTDFTGRNKDLTRLPQNENLVSNVKGNIKIRSTD